MELVKGTGTVTEETYKNVILPKDLVATMREVLTPYLREGIDAAQVAQEVEIALLKSGSRKVTEFLMRKFK
jgi:hypothetical protein